MASTKEECSEAAKNPTKPNPNLPRTGKRSPTTKFVSCWRASWIFQRRPLMQSRQPRSSVPRCRGLSVKPGERCEHADPHLIAALLWTGYGRDCAQMLWEIYNAL